MAATSVFWRNYCKTDIILITIGENCPCTNDDDMMAAGEYLHLILENTAQCSIINQ